MEWLCRTDVQSSKSTITRDVVCAKNVRKPSKGEWDKISVQNFGTQILSCCAVRESLHFILRPVWRYWRFLLKRKAVLNYIFKKIICNSLLHSEYLWGKDGSKKSGQRTLTLLSGRNDVYLVFSGGTRDRQKVDVLSFGSRCSMSWWAVCGRQGREKTQEQLLDFWFEELVSSSTLKWGALWEHGFWREEWSSVTNMVS